MKLLKKKKLSEITSEKEKKIINVQHETAEKLFSKPVFYLT